MGVEMITLQSLLSEFHSTVTKSDIKYDWDCGHSYSNLVHPVLEKGELHLSPEDNDELNDHVSEWQSNNDECPPCFPGGECGCNVNDYEGWLDASIENGYSFEFLNNLYPEQVAHAMIAKVDRILKA
jgi:hypothetical protein